MKADTPKPRDAVIADLAGAAQYMDDRILAAAICCPDCEARVTRYATAVRYALDAVLAEGRAPVSHTEVTPPDSACLWIDDSDGVWQTGCGRSWFFDTGTPADNDARFCFGCGKPLHVAETEEVAS